MKQKNRTFNPLFDYRGEVTICISSYYTGMDLSPIICFKTNDSASNYGADREESEFPNHEALTHAVAMQGISYASIGMDCMIEGMEEGEMDDDNTVADSLRAYYFDYLDDEGVEEDEVSA